jgi:hypothetical protein
MTTTNLYLSIVLISMLIAIGLWFRAINRQP